ncbi:EVI5-like protein isoform X3 [Anneissia japonica]|uniref:EVI5-like protein isoform X3 n=1 Tax=Anneissia japonica TaxID=1529436 RepID=UPI0014259913|nr:EVI5-like protein isoform X3 [Anneissia japonica]
MACVSPLSSTKIMVEGCKESTISPNNSPDGKGCGTLSSNCSIESAEMKSIESELSGCDSGVDSSSSKSVDLLMEKTAAIESITANTEAELVAKLELQNKLLEADTKSTKSLCDSTRSSRRGSNSSLRSTGSVQSNMSNTNASSGGEIDVNELWVTWGKIVNDWEEFSKKKPKQLRELVRAGIPHHFRGIVWQLLCGAYGSSLRDRYAEYLKQTSPHEKLIRRDIARTYPEHVFFKEKDGPGQETLFNVMKAYSLHDREVGYCQGSAFIVGLLLMQMPEEEAFCVLVKLMQEYRLRELFKPSMAELGLCMYQLECMVQELLPDLYTHFITQGFHTSMYASHWFLTLFSVCFSIPLSCRVMDLFILDGMEIIFRIGMSILQMHHDELLAMDMEEMLKFLQKTVPSKHSQDHDTLIHSASQIKYNAKKMKRLEKDYLAFKTKETEEQVEMRRLRTETRLLRQRIDVLEKENIALADKLIHDQLTRAQEAEDSYQVKQELHLTKQQEQETQDKLEGAQIIIKDLKEKPPKGKLSFRFKKNKAREGTSNVYIDSEAEAIILALQEELIAVRLREAETSESLREMEQKIIELEKTNKKIRRAEAGISVDSMQDELIAVKLREAEANLSLKELKQKVSELEDHWQKHLQRSTTTPKRKDPNSKLTVNGLQDELIGVRLREAEAVADLKESRQRVLELETQLRLLKLKEKLKLRSSSVDEEPVTNLTDRCDSSNHDKNQMTSNQMRRIEEERLMLKTELETALEREQDLRLKLNTVQKELCQMEAKGKEELMAIRLRETEARATLAEFTQRIADLHVEPEVQPFLIEMVKKQELLAKEQLSNTESFQNVHELYNIIKGLQAEVRRLKMAHKMKQTSVKEDADAFLNEFDELDDDSVSINLPDIDSSIFEDADGIEGVVEMEKVSRERLSSKSSETTV